MRALLALALSLVLAVLSAQTVAAPPSGGPVAAAAEAAMPCCEAPAPVGHPGCAACLAIAPADAELAARGAARIAPAPGRDLRAAQAAPAVPRPPPLRA